MIHYISQYIYTIILNSLNSSILMGLSHRQGSEPVPETNFEPAGTFTQRKKIGSEPEKMVLCWNQKKFVLPHEP